MTRKTIKEVFRVFGITQAKLARAAGLSEAAVSRQLSGDLRLSEQVQQEAEELIIRRAAEVGIRLLEWAKRRSLSSRKIDEQHSTP